MANIDLMSLIGQDDDNVKKQRLHFRKDTKARQLVGMHGLRSAGGNPGAAVLVAPKGTTGYIPTSGQEGSPKINEPSNGRKLGLANVMMHAVQQVALSGICEYISIYDIVYAAGPFSCSSVINFNLDGHPAITRANSDFSDTVLFLEGVEGTGTISLLLTYADKNGNQFNVSITSISMYPGMLYPIPINGYASGLKSLKALNVVTAAVGTSVNLLIKKHIISSAPGSDSGLIAIGIADCGLQEISHDACLSIVSDSTNSSATPKIDGFVTVVEMD